MNSKEWSIILGAAILGSYASYQLTNSIIAAGGFIVIIVGYSWLMSRY